MAPAVLADAFFRVDDQQRRIRARRAGRHVLEELHVPGRIVQDVVAPGGAKEAARRIDGDALRLFVLERVQ